MFRRLGCRIKVGTVTALLALGAAACASSGGSGAGNPSSPGSGGGAVSGKTLTLGVVADVTGLMSPVSGPTLYAMEAAIAEANAKGGVNGYKFKYKVYDAQSTPVGGLNAARQAIADHVFAIVADSQGLDGGLATLSAAKLPVVGDGDSPNWSGRPYIYSISGNLITQNTTAWAKVLISQGRTRIGVPGGTINAAATVTWEHLVPFAGGKLCFGRVGINGANTASLVAVAHEIIAAHCQGIINPTLYPGTEALQAALNQLGANIPEVEAGDLGPAITSQYGSSVNNMIYANFFASPYDTSDPGVAQYLAAMAKYEPGKQVDCFCIKGYPIVQWFLHSFGQIKGTPTQAKLVAALESTHGYTANGLVPPVQEPAFHTVGSVCLSYSIIKNGQWTSLLKGPNPFICGQRFSYTGK
jgi:ABC-type branched-subunit amino acid transport system substrate-binding protein